VSSKEADEPNEEVIEAMLTADGSRQFDADAGDREHPAGPAPTLVGCSWHERVRVTARIGVFPGATGCSVGEH
jgi:hypothetical protein